MKRTNVNKIAGVSLKIFGASVWAGISLFPLLFSLLSSFKNNTSIYRAPFSLPEKLTWENYRYAVDSTILLRGMWNSLVYSVLAIALIILMALLVSYAYRIRVKGYKFIFLFFIAGMALPIHAMLVPLASIINQLNLRNTLGGIVCVYAATNLSLAVFLANGYMKGISMELDEAAVMDGGGHLRILFQILLPLMKPVIATISIMTFLKVYNDLIFSMLLISDKRKATMSSALMAFKSEYDINYGGTFAAICISVLPIILIYVVFQKQIESGLAAGSVKG
ncbi:MAG: carbohydrate ABC transporter permease [Lachnospiraceae bacterium]|nr:carbohydrate ABC transporter permease [Lachnospiraceae bacterium]